MLTAIDELRVTAALTGSQVNLREIAPGIVSVSGVPAGEPWGYYQTESLEAALGALPFVDDPESPDPLSQNRAQAAIEGTSVADCLVCGRSDWEGQGVLCRLCGETLEATGGTAAVSLLLREGHRQPLRQAGDPSRVELPLRPLRAQMVDAPISQAVREL